jgi:hypothetical protein
MKFESVVKPLKTRGFSNSYNSMFVRVYRTHRLIRPLILACARAEIRALTVPRKSRVPTYLIHVTGSQLTESLFHIIGMDRAPVAGKGAIGTS